MHYRSSISNVTDVFLQDKRDYVVKRLREMGFVIKYVPDSTFYL